MKYLTVAELITHLTQLVEEDPSVAEMLVDMEGCDCSDFVSSVEVVRVFPPDYDDDSREVYLMRAAYDYSS